MHRLVTILDTEVGPNFISNKELAIGIEFQLSTESVPNIYDANKNLLRMLDQIKLQVHLGHTRITLEFILCKTLAASVIIRAEFCN